MANIKGKRVCYKASESALISKSFEPASRSPDSRKKRGRRDPSLLILPYSAVHSLFTGPFRPYAKTFPMD